MVGNGGVGGLGLDGAVIDPGAEARFFPVRSGDSGLLFDIKASLSTCRFRPFWLFARSNKRLKSPGSPVVGDDRLLI
jgi:hypothetical protein